jgi:hypothetical protein
MIECPLVRQFSGEKDRLRMALWESLEGVERKIDARIHLVHFDAWILRIIHPDTLNSGATRVEQYHHHHHHFQRR